MDSSDHFNTILATSEAIFSDKGSKFMGYAYPIHTEEDVKQILLDLKTQHKKARHFCYAYRLNIGGYFRANDDGEPAGSAGKPILNCLLSAEVENVLIVVVRYFGGKLLGIPGLINAYKTASLFALSQAKIIEDFQQVILKITFDYAATNEVMHVVKDAGLIILNQQFDLDCRLTLSVKKASSTEINLRLASVATVKTQAIADDLDQI